MGKDFESHHPGGQFPNAKSTKLPSYTGMQNMGSPCSLPCIEGVHPSHALPSFGFPGQLNFKMDQFKESHGWFYGLPCFRQGFTRNLTGHEKFMPNINLLGKAPPSIDEKFMEVDTLMAGGKHTSKQFLVFDNTGNKTTMIYSSEIGTPIQQLNSWYLKPTRCNNVSADELKIGSNGYHHSEPNLTNELNEDNGIDEGSDEMPEDTEEINALLYSDDEDYCSEDDEVTSTGHSPSTMTSNKNHYWFDEDDIDDDAVSSNGVVKKRKVSSSGHEVASITYTSGSVSARPDRVREYEDDAESSCVGRKLTRPSDGIDSLSGNKRHRENKIRDTVSMLRTIIPDGGEGKDGVMVLDEAIEYLSTLKFKAKSLGLSAM